VASDIFDDHSASELAMNLQPAEDQKMLEESLERVFRENSTGPRIRAAEPLGFDKALWQILVDQGIPLLRVPEANGGGDGSLMHAVLAAEKAGRHLASVPLIEAIVANRLLAKAGGAPAAALLADCAEGKAIVTLALRDAGREPRQLVPAGAIADAVICLEGDKVTIRGGVTKIAFTPDSEGKTQHGSIAAQWLDLRESQKKIELAGGGNAAKDAYLAALEEWKLLTAALVPAIARHGIDNAAAYACEREAFGRKIGEYQGVSHALADAFTDVDSARILAWRAVDAIARQEKDAAAIVSLAYWWSTSNAGAAALKAMRIFGGYGMTMEYDAQLYFRRANAHSIVAGDPDAELERAAARLFDGEKAVLPDAGDVGIDFDWGPKAAAARETMREFCKKRDTPELRRFFRDSLDGFDLKLQMELAKAGLLYPEMPKELGGPAMSGAEATAIREAQSEFDWYFLIAGVTDIIWKIIYHFGSDKLKQDVLPRLASGEAYCSMGYSEPSGGSDIFAAKTTATKDGDDWLINGQKMFTSSGHRAEYSLMITRTGPDKYKGVTLFLVPLKQPGYQVTEIKTIGDDRTNVTFYSDVRVPDAYRLGEVNGGVKVMAAALVIEQSSGDLYTTSHQYMLRHGLEWARKPRQDGKKPIDDPKVRLALAEVAARYQAIDAISRRGVWAFESGNAKKHEGPMIKLLGSESWQWTSQKLLRLMAPDTFVRGREGASAIEWMSRRCLPGTIYAGTSEVQRSIIAEAGLGLPRTRNK
jgi:alkylation response protein AidB-like acyl-CoA dehydrogenase